MDPLHEKFQSVGGGVVVMGLFGNHWCGGCLSPNMEVALYQPAGDEQRKCCKYPGSLHPHPYTHNFPVKAGRYLWNVLTQRPAVSLLVKW